METEIIDAQNLKFFTPLCFLSEKQLDSLVGNAQVIQYDSQKTLIELESTSSKKYFLLEGSLKLRAFDGSESIVEAHTDRAKNPVAQLRPSRYQVTTRSNCKILVLENDFLDHMNDRGLHIEEGETKEQREEDHLIFDMMMALQKGEFLLPSLPDIAMQIREAIAAEDSSADDIARIILGDPAIAAKIVKAANSALYQRHKRVEDCKSAVVSLGTRVTTQLVTTFTLKELYNSNNRLLNKRMQELWEHSIEIASITYVLATMTPGFNAEQAMLAGLIHDIGNVVILNEAIDYPQILDSEEYLNRVIDKMHAQVSSSILKRWDFSREFISLAEEVENWQHDEQEQADLVDLVNIAHLHFYIGLSKQREVPIIDQIPAFHKMALGKLTPRLSVKVLDKAQKKIDETKALLGL